ncbi:CFEM domain-containing protein [Xylaria sp. FL0064]|nr:CFEM domain-containing protein [Xylaria sp. FL0064]
MLMRKSMQLECLVSAVLNTTCAPTDTLCICVNTALRIQVQQCVLASCTVREQLATLNGTNAQCGIVSSHDYSWLPPMLVFLILAGVVFLLRIVSRVMCHTKFWWDDFFNLLATIGVVGYSAVCLVTGNLGLGTETWAVPQENIITLLKLTYVEFILYNWAQITLRTSVLLFYIRVFAVGSKPHRVFWAILIVSDVLSVGFVLFNIFQCTPISYFWQQLDRENSGHCIDASKITLSGGIIDLFWTLLIVIVPLPYILRLKLPPHKKFAATVMFALAIITIAIMGYRFTTLKVHIVGGNATIDSIGVTLWSALELDVALICACMPSFYPLFLRVVHRGRPAPPRQFIPDSSLVTIGGKPSGRVKRRGLWSMTGLTGTNTDEEYANIKESSTECVEPEKASSIWAYPHQVHHDLES